MPTDVLINFLDIELPTDTCDHDWWDSRPHDNDNKQSIAYGRNYTPSELATSGEAK